MGIRSCVSCRRREAFAGARNVGIDRNERIDGGDFQHLSHERLQGPRAPCARPVEQAPSPWTGASGSPSMREMTPATDRRTINAGRVAASPVKRRSISCAPTVSMRPTRAIFSTPFGSISVVNSMLEHAGGSGCGTRPLTRPAMRRSCHLIYEFLPGRRGLSGPHEALRRRQDVYVNADSLRAHDSGSGRRDTSS